ncbi:TQXA domain-containing protein, partial [Streptomyces sp. UNOC14_S4]|uniref:TQXA domain-containing protein n=1 Tax=Streptomyces sp. UNOC14_S4 TaxID=2872340 RepID=UPI001E298194
MTSVKRRGATRLAAGALVSGLAAVGTIVAAGPAFAVDTPRDTGGVSATVGRITAGSGATVHDSRRTGDIQAGLFEMKVDGGGSLQTYGIDILTNTVEGAKYKEVGWGESPLHANKNAGRIRWILQHSYPQVNDLAALAKDADSGTLDANTAAAGTQVAIWRYSDGVDVAAKDGAAQKLADYLYQHAQGAEEPEASLSLTPSAVSGRSGGRIGPVTVHTSASSVTVAPLGDAQAKGVRIVDKDGKPVTSTRDGGEVYFDVRRGARDGALSLKATAATKALVGRVFAGDHTTTQSQILAGSSESTVSATATATWAEKGAIPAVSARKDCAKGGVEVTADNKGDAPFVFDLDGTRHTVPAGGSETVLVKVAEDQAYRFGITGQHGFSRTFSGILDCVTAESLPSTAAGGGPAGMDPGTGPGAGTRTERASRMRPASAGGADKGVAGASADGG